MLLPLLLNCLGWHLKQKAIAQPEKIKHAWDTEGSRLDPLHPQSKILRWKEI